MTGSRTARLINIVLVAALALIVGAGVAGCGGKSAATKAPSTLTAKGALPIAQSALSTTAPDAKLLIVQTAGIVSETSTPGWEYLFGSQKTDTVYAVVVKDGKATASPYGTAGLTATEWAGVPGIDAWKIDSDAAYKKALAANKNANSATPYGMGFLTYIPKSAETSTTMKPFIWDVTFDPQGSPISFSVDVKTGAAYKSPTSP